MASKIQSGQIQIGGFVAVIAGAATAAVVSAGTITAGPVSRAAVEAALPPLEAMAQDIVADGSVPGLAIAIVHEDELV